MKLVVTIPNYILHVKSGMVILANYCFFNYNVEFKPILNVQLEKLVALLLLEIIASIYLIISVRSFKLQAT